MILKLPRVNGGKCRFPHMVGPSVPTTHTPTHTHPAHAHAHPHAAHIFALRPGCPYTQCARPLTHDDSHFLQRKLTPRKPTQSRAKARIMGTENIVGRKNTKQRCTLASNTPVTRRVLSEISSALYIQIPSTKRDYIWLINWISFH